MSSRSCKPSSESSPRALTEARSAAGAELAGAVRERLAALAMDGAEFEVALAARETFGPTGADEVEFLIAPNPGVPAGPLRETASGRRAFARDAGA